MKGLMLLGKRGIWWGFILLVVGILCNGCAGNSIPSGGLHKRLAISKLFESGILLPDHTYYIEGSEIEPDAIIALSNSYQLQTKLWSKKNWTEENLKKAVFWMQTGQFGFCTVKAGLLLAPDGQQVGVWYSKKERGIIRQPAEGVVEVYPFRHLPGSPCWKETLIDEL